MSKELAPHQQRVLDEKRELDERIKKLSGFFSTPTFHDLQGPERSRLSRQRRAMTPYSNILGERIAAF